MALYVISRVTKYNKKWIRIFSDVDNKMKDLKEEDLIFILKDKRDNGWKIQNVGLQGDKLVGTTGSIDKILDKNCFVVLGKVDDKYKLVDMKGKTRLFTVPEVKKLTNKGILQNAKLVEKNGKVFISGIGWEIPEIAEKKEIKKVSKKKRYSDKECEELLKNFGGNIRKLQTFCGKPCYLSSKSNTEHLLWIPSNVTKLNLHKYFNGWSETDFTPQIWNLEGSLKVIGGSELVSCYDMFCRCENLKELDLSNFDTHNVNYMFGMFYNCERLKKLDLSNFDTHKVTNMVTMFGYCVSLEELDLSSFNTQNVTIMFGMFTNCESLKKLDLSNFDAHNVEDIRCLFSECASLESVKCKDKRILKKFEQSV